MRLSELQNILQDLAVKVGPDGDPEVIFLSDKEVFQVNYSTDGVINLKEVIFLSEKRYHY